MKQTAVEWLASQLGEHIIWEEKIIDLVEKAKAMDKEQKIKFANQFAEAVMGGCLLSPTEFYNETFKSE